MNKLAKLLPGVSSTRNAIKAFAEHVGLVYFGYVSQHSDEHHILRGVTVSTKHRDDHYCIGTVDGYDVVFVERSDTIAGKPHAWHIIELDLHSNHHLPHFFIMERESSSALADILRLKHANYSPVITGAVQPFDPSFTAALELRTTPMHALAVETLLADMAPTLAAHFKGLCIEVVGQSLYLYSEKSKLTDSLLTTMLDNGIWLAKMLDTKNQP